MFIQSVDLSSGDLGMADIMTHPSDFPILVLHIHTILNKLPNSVYSFMFPAHFTIKYIHELLDMVKREYPNACFYNVNGRELFDARGLSGGVIAGHICYLISNASPGS